jgi:hypothetical protein
LEELRLPLQIPLIGWALEMHMKNGRRAACAVAMLLSGCQTSSTAQRPIPSGEEARASFINKVWKVGSSPTIEKGMLYVFLSEGTLVLASPHATPAFGRWEYKNGALTTTEESIRYKVDILKLTRDEFRIRIHNPGEPVDITLIPAEGVPLPE